MQSPALVKPMMVVLDLSAVEGEGLRAGGCSDLFGKLLSGWGAGIFACGTGSAGSMLCPSSNESCGGEKDICGAKVLAGVREPSAFAGLGVLARVPQRGQLLRFGESGNPH
jgi:hypothetical protein